MDILNVFSHRTQDSPREIEIERFGYEIAERLAIVRNIHRVSRNCKRHRWAREVVLTRALEGDIERVKRNEKTATSTKKGNTSKLNRRGRRYGDFNQESFERLLMTSSKYQRKDWSKVVHGKENLKNSMEGFKSKVNEELSEHRNLLTDDDSISEHSIGNEEAGRTEFGEASKDSLALLSLWENNRVTPKPSTNVPVKGILKEITHSKVDIASRSSLYDQLVTTRRKSVLQEAGTHSCVVRERSDVISDPAMPESVEKINRASDGEDGILLGNEYEQQRRSRRNEVAHEFKGMFQRRTNCREDPTKLERGDQSAEAINDTDTSLLYKADLSSSYDRSAKQQERLRTRSLGPTSRAKPLSTRESCKPRVRSVRHIRIDTALDLSARRGKSDASAVVSDTEGTSQESTVMTDTDVGNGRLHRFSIRPDMSQEIYLSSAPLRKQSFGSNKDSRDVAKGNSAGNGEKVSSVLYIDWRHLKVSDENEPDMPTGPNSATGKRDQVINNTDTSLLNEADLSSSYDLIAKQPKRIRTRSLGPTSREKPLSAQESYTPRARSARHVRIDTALALSAQRGKSDANTFVADTEGSSQENTALKDTEVGNGRLHRFSIRPDMSEGACLSSAPLQKLSFGSNEDWRKVAKKTSAGNGETVSSVPYIEWCHLEVSDKKEPDMPTGPNFATGKGDPSEELINDTNTSLLDEADLSSSYDLIAKQPERLRTRSLEPTSSEKPLSARESYTPRARSARHIRIDTALALPAQRGKSDGSAFVADTAGTSQETPALTDTDIGNRRLYRFSIGPDMSEGTYLSSTPLQKLPFGSNENWRDVAKGNSAGNGEGVSSVPYRGWCHFEVSDENEPDMPTGLNSATGKGDQSAEVINDTDTSLLNEADLSSYDLIAKQPERLRARSLEPTSREKPLSAQESYTPRARSARRIRIETALALSAQRGTSDGSAFEADTEGTSQENTALTDTDTGNGRLYRFSI